MKEQMKDDGFEMIWEKSRIAFLAEMDRVVRLNRWKGLIALAKLFSNLQPDRFFLPLWMKTSCSAQSDKKDIDLEG